MQEEIELRKKEIHTDGYPMSIGEVISLYRRKEVDIHPEFQRFFRWTPLQKTKLIESILLGIPIPPIFVSQREDGVWDVVDGLQRLSTIFEFVGVLRDEHKVLIPPSTLVGTQYLPSLEGKTWGEPQEEGTTKKSGAEREFPSALRIAFKREKLDFKIVKKESDPATKYELFQRLNTLGTSLSPQEVRNCLLIMINRELYQWLADLATFGPFQRTIALSEKQLDERYDVELALRFIVLLKSSTEELKDKPDIGEFLTEQMKLFALDKTFDRKGIGEDFKETFKLVEKVLQDQAFRRFDAKKKRFMGGFSISAYEVIAVGVGANVTKWKVRISHSPEWKTPFLEIVQGLWADATFLKYSGSGVRASTRLPNLIPLGRRIFKP